MRKILPIFTLLYLILPIGAIAIVIEIQNPLTAPDFETIVDNLINFIFNITIVLVPLMILIGAFYLITAAGDSNKITTGKNIIIYTLIGFAIVLLAKGILAVIRELLGVR